MSFGTAYALLFFQIRNATGLNSFEEEERTMMNIDLKSDYGIDYGKAEAMARRAAEERGAGYTLMSWYDKARGMGAPQEACSLENWKCVRDYAVHHNASLRVAVNTDEYEFFFAKAPADAAELDADEVTDVHAGIARDEFDNVQGG
jgi:hypothetical protein